MRKIFRNNNIIILWGTADGGPKIGKNWVRIDGNKW